MALINDGIPSSEDLATKMPNPARQQSGPFCVIECFQEIPCDPCVKSCARNAISMQGDINVLPQVNFERCNGCGRCIFQCPGLAIFVVDMSKDDNYARVMLPYEFNPIPQVRENVCCLNRAGEELGWFEVEKVMHGKTSNKTYVITVKVPHDLANEVRAIKVWEGRSNV